MLNKSPSSLHRNSAILESRTIPLEGAFNLRDMGGFPAKDGKKVRWHLVYRSDELTGLSKKDLQQLDSRHIKTIVDFRTDEERKRAPSRLPDSVKQVLKLEITPGNLNDLSTIHEYNATQIMFDMNRALVREGRVAYTVFFKTLMQENCLPLLFNCAAGKDRTGLAAALFLSALDVPRFLIMEDYLMSAHTVRRKYDFILKEQPWLEALVTVRPSYLDAALDEIDQQFGGMQNYLENELDVDLSALQAKYTE